MSYYNAFKKPGFALIVISLLSFLVWRFFAFSIPLYHDDGAQGLYVKFHNSWGLNQNLCLHPPLFGWLQILIHNLVPWPLLSMRMLPAITHLSALFLGFLIIKRLYGDNRLVKLSYFILAAFSYLSFYMGAVIEEGPSLQMLIMTALYYTFLLYRETGHIRHLVVMGALWGLGLMIKHFSILFGGFIFILLILNLPWRQTLRSFGLIALLAIAFGGLYLSVYKLAYGNDFSMVFQSICAHSATRLSIPDGFRRFQELLLPIGPFLLFLIILSLFDRSHRDLALAVSLMIVCYLLFLPDSRYLKYMCYYTTLGTLLLVMSAGAMSRLPLSERAWLFGLLASLALGVLFIRLNSGQPVTGAYKFFLSANSPVFAVRWNIMATVIKASLFLAILYCVFIALKKRKLIQAALLLLFCLGNAYHIVFIYSAVRGKSYRDAVAWAREYLETHSCKGTLYSWRADLPYFTDRCPGYYFRHHLNPQISDRTYTGCLNAPPEKSFELLIQSEAHFFPQKEVISRANGTFILINEPYFYYGHMLRGLIDSIAVRARLIDSLVVEGQKIVLVYESR